MNVRVRGCGVSDFDDGDLQWLKEVAAGAMDNILSVGRAERVVSRITELERIIANNCDPADATEADAGIIQRCLYATYPENL